MGGCNRCCVAHCGATSVNTPSASFHRIPNKDPVRQQWLKFLHLKEPVGKSLLVCSSHFTSCSFEVNYKEQLLGTTQRRTLVTGVVPTIRRVDDSHSEPNPREQRAIIRKRKALVEELLAEEEVIIPLEEFMVIEDPPSCCDSKSELMRVLEENVDLKVKNQGLKGELEQLKARKAEAELVKEAVKDVLSSNQVEMVMGLKKKVNWTEDELSRAFTLRSFGIKGYEFVRRNLHIPLPCLNTLNAWNVNSEDDEEVQSLVAESLKKD